MQENEIIDSKLISDFVFELGNYNAVDIYKLDPRKKISKKDAQKLETMANIISQSILRGFILANYQPELANILVKQINQAKPGYTDEILENMLFIYKSFIHLKELEKKWK
jgi:D-alanyl-D-alanine dipeptidase